MGGGGGGAWGAGGCDERGARAGGFAGTGRAAAANGASRPDGAGHFFELLRFDFVVEELAMGDIAKAAAWAEEELRRHDTTAAGYAQRSSRVSGALSLKPWLIEVNASPNLKPSSPQQEKVLARLCAAVADEIADMASSAVAAVATSASPAATTTTAAVDDAEAASMRGGFERIALSASGALIASEVAASTKTRVRGDGDGDGGADGHGDDATRCCGPHRSLAEHADVDCQMSAWGPYSDCNAVGTPRPERE